MRPPAEEAARTLVTERYPDAVQAWLAGSVSRGEGTPTSDLDITVLLDEVEVHRETVEYAGWPAELFVHTAASIEFHVAKDLARRHPTMARLVATGIPLLGEGGADVRRNCAEALERGPGPVSDAELEMMRYGLTDLLDDLVHVRPGPETTATAIGVWRAAAELTLAAGATWNGTGKWLARELESLDGDPHELASVAGAVLEGCGGRFRAGLHLVADLSEA